MYPLSSIPLDFQSHREEPAIQRADVNDLPHFLWATLYFLSFRLLVCLPRASHNPPGRLMPDSETRMQQFEIGSASFSFLSQFDFCFEVVGSHT